MADQRFNRNFMGFLHGIPFYEIERIETEAVKPMPYTAVRDKKPTCPECYRVMKECACAMEPNIGEGGL